MALVCERTMAGAGGLGVGGVDGPGGVCGLPA